MSSPFIILAGQRTGSTWVQDMLGSHPEAKVYTELFLPDARGRPMWAPNDVDFLSTFLDRQNGRSGGTARLYHTVRYLNLLFDQQDVRLVGFKCMYDHARHNPVVLAYAALRRVKVIHLVRHNLLDIAISTLLAQATGVYHLASDQRPAVPWWRSERVDASVRVDVGGLTEYLARLDRQRSRVRSWLGLLGIPSYEIEYEQVTSDPAQFGAVLEFLGLPATDAPRLQSGLERVRTRRQSDVIENLDEVRRALTGTSYEAFLR